MAQSIREHGILEPIVVEPADNVDGEPRYSIAFGFRRHAGAKMAELELIPALIRYDLIPADRTIKQVVENLERKSITVLEEAAAYEQIALLGRDDVQIGKAVGLAPKDVASRRQLMALPEATRDKVVAHQSDLEYLEQAVEMAQYADDAAAVKFLEPHLGTYNFKYKIRDWPGEKAKREAKAAEKERLKNLRTEHKAAVKLAATAGTRPPAMPKELEPPKKPAAPKDDYEARQKAHNERLDRIRGVAATAADVRFEWIGKYVNGQRGASVKIPPGIRGILNMAVDRLQFDAVALKWLNVTDDQDVDPTKLTDTQALLLLAIGMSDLSEPLLRPYEWNTDNDGPWLMQGLVKYLSYPISDDEQLLADGKVK